MMERVTTGEAETLHSIINMDSTCGLYSIHVIDMVAHDLLKYNQLYGNLNPKFVVKTFTSEEMSATMQMFYESGLNHRVSMTQYLTLYNAKQCNATLVTDDTAYAEMAQEMGIETLSTNNLKKRRTA